MKAWDTWLGGPIVCALAVSCSGDDSSGQTGGSSDTTGSGNVAGSGDATSSAETSNGTASGTASGTGRTAASGTTTTGGGASGSGASGGAGAAGGSGGGLSTGGSGGAGDSSGGGPSSGGAAGAGGTTASGGTGTGGNPPVECPNLLDDLGCGAGTVFRRRVSVLLVLDKSGSMNRAVGDSTRWSTLNATLAELLPAAEGGAQFGLELFPYPEDEEVPISATECGVDGNCCEMPSAAGVNVPIGPGSVAEILSLLDATEPGGGTPTAVALQKALAYFTTGEGATLGGERYVLLLTDGGANCNPVIECTADECTTNLDGSDCVGSAPMGNCCDYSFAGDGTACVDHARTLEQVEALSEAGIGSFVVGIPGSEAYAEYLDEIAVSGGLPDPNGEDAYYRVDDLTNLRSTLATVLGAALADCEITLDSVPVSTPRVAIDCIEASQATGEWEYSEGNLVTLLGDTCSALADAATNTLAGTGRMPAVDVIFSCQP